MHRYIEPVKNFKMANEVSLSVTIGGKAYPLLVKADEKEQVQSSVMLINSILKDIEQNYAVKDRQDLFAMAALELANRLVRLENEQKGNEGKEIAEKLFSMETYLSDYLHSARSVEIEKELGRP